MKFEYQELAGKLLPIVPIELKGKKGISFDAFVNFAILKYFFFPNFIFFPKLSAISPWNLK